MNYQPFDSADIKKRLLDEERADAARRLGDRNYWGDTGLWLALAVDKAEQAIDGVPLTPTITLSAWIAAVTRAIEEAHETFRKEEDDPDGYGSATFHAIRRRLPEI